MYNIVISLTLIKIILTHFVLFFFQYQQDVFWVKNKGFITVSKNYYIEKNIYILLFFDFIIPLFFTLKTSKYCDKGKKDQHKNQESNIQQYTFKTQQSGPSRLQKWVRVVFKTCSELSLQSGQTGFTTHSKNRAT